ncbi:DUF3179 domain-containing protein [Desulfovibrio litoralis]|nr:DUF3179 domain-containing protein [Desulfovibrio litoralis]
MSNGIYPSIQLPEQNKTEEKQDTDLAMNDIIANSKRFDVLLTNEQIQSMQDILFKTQLPPDQTPPITNPSFIPVIEAELGIEDDESVLVLELTTPPRIYPIRILLWHEILYDMIKLENGQEDIPIFITYSPLTATAVAYLAKIDEEILWLRSSGSLLHGNTVFVDQKTDSLWSQLLGVCFKGIYEGQNLTRLPLNRTSWKAAAAKYPNALVLSRNTGFQKSYGKDPYQSFYKSNALPSGINSTEQDKIMPLKQLVLGIILDQTPLAVDTNAVKKENVINFTIGINNLVAFYNEEFDTIRIYNSQLDPNDPPLDFRFDGEYFRDNKTNSQWNAEGLTIRGRLKNTQLKPILTISTMWYAWFAFHPISLCVTQ